MNGGTVHNQILALETSLLTPQVRASFEELNSLLCDDFLEFGSAGEIWDKESILRLLEKEMGVTFSMSSFTTREIAPEVVLATFRVVRLSDGQEPTASLRSSIWVLKEGAWLMTFHQGTPTALEINP